MPIDTTHETLVPLSQAAKTFPCPVHQTTWWRWCIHGVKGIKLEYVRLGIRIFTSKEAIQRFMDALARSDQSLDKPDLMAS